MARRPVATILEEIGTLLEIKGENPFKSRAYYNAARVLAATENLDELIRDRRLTEIKGIGEALSRKIEEYSETGQMAYYEELAREVPPSLLELTEIPNLGPKKIKVLYDRLGITNMGELEYACKENRLVSLPGFGLKTQEKIQKGIEFLKRHKGEFLLGDVYGEAMEIKDLLQKASPQDTIMVCGSIRRHKEIIRDMDFLSAGEDPKRVTDAFVSLHQVEEVLLTGETKTSCRLVSGIEADLRVVREKEFPYALMYFTGSKEHNVKLRGIAKRKGWKLNEYGLFDGERLIGLQSEEEIYRTLGLLYVPPELREDTGEVEAAEEGRLPDLITMDDIRGTFHVHTDFSDGMDEIERMVRAAMQLGFTYLGISDHSKTAAYAGGLKPEDLRRQWEIIDDLNEKLKPFRIFKGTESDILPDGSLDFDEEILKGLDFVVASIHSSFGLRRDEQERRIIRALENPYTTMLGHPTGRLLLSRDGYDVDMRTLIDAAAANNVIMELNASPYRLDIDWRYMKYAKEKGVMISINPDAHAAAGLAEISYGVGIARKGWQEKGDVVNTRTADEVEELFRKMRSSRL